MHILHIPDHSVPLDRSDTCGMLAGLKQLLGRTTDRYWFASIGCYAGIDRRLIEAGALP